MSKIPVKIVDSTNENAVSAGVVGVWFGLGADLVLASTLGEGNISGGVIPMTQATYNALIPIPSNALLAEDGSPILAEDGSFILTE